MEQKSTIKYSTIQTIEHSKKQNLFVIVEEVRKFSEKISNGSLHTLIVVVDPSCSAVNAIRKDLLIHIFFNSTTDKFITKLEIGDILRLTSVMGELKNGRMYGKIISSNSIVKFSPNTNLSVPYTTSSYQFNGKDMQIISHLHSWMLKRHNYIDFKMSSLSPPKRGEQLAKEILNKSKVEEITGPGVYNIYCMVTAVRPMASGNVLLRLSDGTATKVYTQHLNLSEATCELDSTTEEIIYNHNQIWVLVLPALADVAKELKYKDFIYLKNMKGISMDKIEAHSGRISYLHFLLTDDSEIRVLPEYHSKKQRILKLLEELESSQEISSQKSCVVENLRPTTSDQQITSELKRSLNGEILDYVEEKDLSSNDRGKTYEALNELLLMASFTPFTIEDIPQVEGGGQPPHHQQQLPQALSIINNSIDYLASHSSKVVDNNHLCNNLSNSTELANIVPNLEELVRNISQLASKDPPDVNKEISQSSIKYTNELRSHNDIFNISQCENSIIFDTSTTTADKGKKKLKANRTRNTLPKATTTLGNQRSTNSKDYDSPSKRSSDKELNENVFSQNTFNNSSDIFHPQKIDLPLPIYSRCLSTLCLQSAPKASLQEIRKTHEQPIRLLAFVKTVCNVCENPCKDCDKKNAVCFHDCIWGKCSFCKTSFSPFKLRDNFSPQQLRCSTLPCPSCPPLSASIKLPCNYKAKLKINSIKPFIKVKFVLRDVESNEDEMFDLTEESAVFFFDEEPKFMWNVVDVSYSFRRKVEALQEREEPLMFVVFHSKVAKQRGLFKICRTQLC